MITQKELKELLHYDRSTGVFKWIKTGKGIKKKEAGTVENDGYLRIQISKKTYKAHRLAFLYEFGEFPKYGIDHINGDKLDNSIINLRIADQKINAKNSKINILNTSGTTGVTFDKSRNKWIAQIKVNYKNKHLGRFEKKEDAITARKKAEKQYGFHENHGRKL